MKQYLKHSGTKTTIITNEDGEVLDEKTIVHSYIVDDKETFYLIYSSLIGLLGEISNPAVKVLSYILLNYKTDTQFEIGNATRKMIAEKMKISNSSVANALTELKASTILYSFSRSMYQINPKYAFQGSTNNRKKALKAIIELRYGKTN
jgi:hypothetical protein